MNAVELLFHLADVSCHLNCAPSRVINTSSSSWAATPGNRNTIQAGAPVHLLSVFIRRFMRCPLLLDDLRPICRVDIQHGWTTHNDWRRHHHQLLCATQHRLHRHRGHTRRRQDHVKSVDVTSILLKPGSHVICWTRTWVWHVVWRPPQQMSRQFRSSMKTNGDSRTGKYG